MNGAELNSPRMSVNEGGWEGHPECKALRITRILKNMSKW